MKNKKRSVNRNLIFALIAFEELNLGKLGRRCDPPVTRASISMFLSGIAGGERLKEQITAMLAPSIPALRKELEAIDGNELSRFLFPPEQEAGYE
ncbi:MAG: hypothetical protein JW902_12255 [Syntrophaceae bacterium]|nr:hypothetical protein [Syntrophaceae bacterium]